MGRAVNGFGVRGHYLRRRLKGGRGALFLAALCLAVIVMATLVYRLGGIAPIALLDALVAAALVALAVLLFALASLVAAWFTGAEGGGPMAQAVGVATLALLPFGLGVYLASASPRANLAFTERMEPDPVGYAIIETEAAPAGTQTMLDRLLTAGERPLPLAGRQFLAPAPRVFEAAREVLRRSDWEIESVEVDEPEPAELEALDPEAAPSLPGAVEIPVPRFRAEIEDEAADPMAIAESDGYRIFAVAADPLFGLPSDIEIVIGEEGRESFVEMVSASRATPIDLGQNRRYVETFMDEIEAAMAGRETFSPGG